ncbi:hypothetical protein [Paraburkholderia tuberum]|nr:hypothetical protein [Paraburkholderia tuberum]
MLHNGVPTDKEHPARIALDNAQAALASTAAPLPRSAATVSDEREAFERAMESISGQYFHGGELIPHRNNPDEYQNGSTQLAWKIWQARAASTQATATLTDERRQTVRDAVAAALGDAYDCLRVWEAWGIGTMSQDDFQLVTDDESRIAEIADAAIDALLAEQSATPQATSKARGDHAIWLLEALIDIYDDAQNNAPEDRCYAEGAWTATLTDIRQFIANAPRASEQAGPIESWTDVEADLSNDEREAVGGMTNALHVMRRIRRCDNETAAQVVLEHFGNEQRRAALEEAARLAEQWGDARLPDHGGNALRNCAVAIRALSQQKAGEQDD